MAGCSMVIYRFKLALFGVAGLALLLAMSWPVDYCGGHSNESTLRVQQFTMPACALGQNVIELNGLGARVVVDGQRLYLLDAARTASVTTQYRIDGGALVFTSEVTGN